MRTGTTANIEVVWQALSSAVKEDMLAPAKSYRLHRLLSQRSGRCVMIPMDHGVTLGPIPGLARIEDTVRDVVEGGADCVVVHKGQAGRAQPALSRRTGLVIHLSASLAGRHVQHKFQVCTVAEALRLGADAVSVHVNFGSDTEPEQVAKLASVAAECDAWNIPLLCMAYVREDGNDSRDPARIRHVVRVAAELGADLVKCQYTGDQASFRSVVDACEIPVLIAGGPRMSSDRQMLQTVADAMSAGARGVSCGRNIFEHARPALLTRQIARIVHEGASVASCLDALTAATEVRPPAALSVRG